MKRVFNVFPSDLAILSTDVGNLEGMLETINSVVPLSKIVFERTSAEGVEPKVFLYKIESADLRLWKQDITFDNAANPLMTFTVADAWRLSEFSSQRTLRNALVSLVAKYPTLEKLVYNYLA